MTIARVHNVHVDTIEKQMREKIRDKRVSDRGNAKVERNEQTRCLVEHREQMKIINSHIANVLASRDAEGRCGAFLANKYGKVCGRNA